MMKNLMILMMISKTLSGEEAQREEKLLKKTIMSNLIKTHQEKVNLFLAVNRRRKIKMHTLLATILADVAGGMFLGILVKFVWMEVRGQDLSPPTVRTIRSTM